MTILWIKIFLFYECTCTLSHTHFIHMCCGCSQLQIIQMFDHPRADTWCWFYVLSKPEGFLSATHVISKKARDIQKFTQQRRPPNDSSYKWWMIILNSFCCRKVYSNNTPSVKRCSLKPVACLYAEVQRLSEFIKPAKRRAYSNWIMIRRSTTV